MMGAADNLEEMLDFPSILNSGRGCQNLPENYAEEELKYFLKPDYKAIVRSSNSITTPTLVGYTFAKNCYDAMKSDKTNAE